MIHSHFWGMPSVVSMGMGTSFLTNGMVPRCVQQGREQHVATSSNEREVKVDAQVPKLLKRCVEASSSAPANSSKRARSVKMDILPVLHLLSPSAHAA